MNSTSLTIKPAFKRSSYRLLIHYIYKASLKSEDSIQEFIRTFYITRELIHRRNLTLEWFRSDGKATNIDTIRDSINFFRFMHVVLTTHGPDDIKLFFINEFKPPLFLYKKYLTEKCQLHRVLPEDAVDKINQSFLISNEETTKIVVDTSSKTSLSLFNLFSKLSPTLLNEIIEIYKIDKDTLYQLINEGDDDFPNSLFFRDLPKNCLPVLARHLDDDFLFEKAKEFKRGSPQFYHALTIKKRLRQAREEETVIDPAIDNKNEIIELANHDRDFLSALFQAENITTDSLCAEIEKFRPTALALEQFFFANPDEHPQIRHYLDTLTETDRKKISYLLNKENIIVPLHIHVEWASREPIEPRLKCLFENMYEDSEAYLYRYNPHFRAAVDEQHASLSAPSTSARAALLSIPAEEEEETSILEDPKETPSPFEILKTTYIKVAEAISQHKKEECETLLNSLKQQLGHEFYFAFLEKFQGQLLLIAGRCEQVEIVKYLLQLRDDKEFYLAKLYVATKLRKEKKSPEILALLPQKATLSDRCKIGDEDAFYEACKTPNIGAIKDYLSMTSSVLTLPRPATTRSKATITPLRILIQRGYTQAAELLVNSNRIQWEKEPPYDEIESQVFSHANWRTFSELKRKIIASSKPFTSEKPMTPFINQKTVRVKKPSSSENATISHVEETSKETTEEQRRKAVQSTMEDLKQRQKRKAGKQTTTGSIEKTTTLSPSTSSYTEVFNVLSTSTSTLTSTPTATTSVATPSSPGCMTTYNVPPPSPLSFYPINPIRRSSLPVTRAFQPTQAELEHFRDKRKALKPAAW